MAGRATAKPCTNTFTQILPQFNKLNRIVREKRREVHGTTQSVCRVSLIARIAFVEVHSRIVVERFMFVSIFFNFLHCTRDVLYTLSAHTNADRRAHSI